MITEPKVCYTCKQIKSDFWVNRHGNPNRNCFECGSNRNSKYYTKHHRNTPEKKLAWALRTIKQKCQKNDIPFDIKIEDVLPIPLTCPALGIVMGYDGDRDSVPTFDRLIPSRGYVKGNVTIISHRANRMKSDATSDEISRLANWMQSFAEPAPQAGLNPRPIAR